jgi:putative ABC transport system ATP-binding protein
LSLIIENLRKNYKQGALKIEALKGVSAEIKTGELVAILGASGSGKSTLLGLLAGLDNPNEGRILIDGVDLYSLSDVKRTQFRAKNISLVFQQFHLLPHLTALENVSLPLEILGEEEMGRAAALLTAVGLGSRLHHLPTQLSGGECQRVAIARSLITKPKLLLADEPSGSLDNDTANTVMDLFFATIKEKQITSLLVTHNLELAKRCDRILNLKSGVI